MFMIQLIYPMYIGMIPSKQANVHQRIYTCYALAATGKVNVHIPFPAVKQYTAEQILSQYGLPPIDGLFFYPVAFFGKILYRGLFFRGSTRIYLLLLSLWLLVLHGKHAILFGREIEYLGSLLPWSHLLGRNVVYEAHGIISEIQADYPRIYGINYSSKSLFKGISAHKERNFLKGVDLVISTTANLKHILVEKYGIDKYHVVVIPNGASSIDLLDNTDTGEKTRKEDNIIKVVYTGQFFPWKGVDQIIASTVYLPMNYKIFLVGGNDQADINRLTSLARELGVIDRVHFIGQVDPPEARRWQRCADVLVLSMMSGNVEADQFTSPIKAFEYMVSGKPIVAPDLPMLREIFRHGDNVWFYDVNNPQSMADAIQYLVSNPELALKLSMQAKNDVYEHYTWDKRAERILEVLKVNLKSQ